MACTFADTLPTPLTANGLYQICGWTKSPNGVPIDIFAGEGGIVNLVNSQWAYNCVTTNVFTGSLSAAYFSTGAAGSDPGMAGAFYVYGINISEAATPSDGFDLTQASPDTSGHYGNSPTLAAVSGTPTATHCANFLSATQIGDAGAPCPTGTGTVSGQANGVIPLASSATAITLQSHLDDGVTTAGTITSSEPIAIAGPTHGITIQAGTAVAPVSGKVIISSDPTVGNLMVSQNGATAIDPVPLVAPLVTTAATSDNVTVTGMTSTGHCVLQPTNAAASTATGTYVSNKITNQITVTHAVTANMDFDVICTSY